MSSPSPTPMVYTPQLPSVGVGVAITTPNSRTVFTGAGQCSRLHKHNLTHAHTNTRPYDQNSAPVVVDQCFEQLPDHLSTCGANLAHIAFRDLPVEINTHDIPTYQMLAKNHSTGARSCWRSMSRRTFRRSERSLRETSTAQRTVRG